MVRNLPTHVTKVTKVIYIYIYIYIYTYIYTCSIYRYSCYHYSYVYGILLDHVCCNKKLSMVYLALDAEMLRLWEETDPFHQIDYCMDDVYAQLGGQVSID